jgi:hypothetical protein
LLEHPDLGHLWGTGITAKHALMACGYGEHERGETKGQLCAYHADDPADPEWFAVWSGLESEDHGEDDATEVAHPTYDAALQAPTNQ